LIDPVVTEVAFGGDALWRCRMGVVFEDRFAIVKNCPLVLDAGALIIGARQNTRAAADAAVMIDQNNTVIAGIAGLGRADRYARRVLAMTAEGRQKCPAGVRKFTEFVFQNLGVVDIVRRVVLDLAGDGTGVATDAFLDINDHSVF